jgi:hypothetical protein
MTKTRFPEDPFGCRKPLPWVKFPSDPSSHRTKPVPCPHARRPNLSFPPSGSLPDPASGPRLRAPPAPCAPERRHRQAMPVSPARPAVCGCMAPFAPRPAPTGPGFGGDARSQAEPTPKPKPKPKPSPRRPSCPDSEVLWTSESGHEPLFSLACWSASVAGNPANLAGRTLGELGCRRLAIPSTFTDPAFTDPARARPSDR